MSEELTKDQRVWIDAGINEINTKFKQEVARLKVSYKIKLDKIIEEQFKLRSTHYGRLTKEESRKIQEIVRENVQEALKIAYNNDFNNLRDRYDQIKIEHRNKVLKEIELKSIRDSLNADRFIKELNGL